MSESRFTFAGIARDLTAGSVVFLVALPLCLGVAVASKADAFTGILAGIVGGIVVGFLSGSHTSVSGPAAGLTAVVAMQIAELKTFNAFLLALFIGGLMQIGLGIVRGGVLAAFFPSSVIKGLLAAIGTILILKQIPHLVGHDADPEGDFAFDQPKTGDNTFTAFISTLYDLHPGAALIGILSLILLVTWDKTKFLKESKVPAPLIVVLFGVGLNVLFDLVARDGPFDIDEEWGNHLVFIRMKGPGDFLKNLQSPDFSQWANPVVYTAATTLAIVASLETLLNLNAVDKLDPQQRTSPPDRELIAQGIGNTLLGLIGGIPMTSVIVRSSVNINAGSQTRLSAIFHGVLLLGCVAFLPTYLNMIPLSCLAAILIVTGAKLASPALFKQMWNEGRYQFIPFILTLVSIVLTDLLKGILIGLAISTAFILTSNLRRPMRRVLEKHLGGEVLNIQLASQVSFLNRAALERILREVPRGGHVLIDATNTDYIDPDVLSLIRDFKEQIAPAHGVQLSLRGFRDKYQLKDDIQYIDYSTRELQDLLTSQQVLQILQEGNERFRTGHRLTRDLGRQLDASARGQHPLAVVLSCIDSRSPAELIFDLGLGDIFSVRIAGNVISPNVLASMEYGTAVAGAKLILVLGHTQCGAVKAAVQLACSASDPAEATGCQHLAHIVNQIQQVVDAPTCQRVGATENAAAVFDEVAQRNVLRMVQQILIQSQTIKRVVAEGRIIVVGALYDVASGKVDIITGPIGADELHASTGITEVPAHSVTTSS